MPIYQVHPDGFIIIRSAAYGIYADTPENFLLDAGQPAYLPAPEYTDFWYNDDPSKESYKQNALDPSNRTDTGRIQELDDLLTNLSPIYAAQAARQNPPPDINSKKRDKVDAIRNELVTRASATVTALNSIAALELMAELWPMLDTTKAGPDLLHVKDLVVHARGEVQALNTMDEAQVDAYDPTTGWPV